MPQERGESAEAIHVTIREDGPDPDANAAAELLTLQAERAAIESQEDE